MSEIKLTPMMAQYLSIKEQYPDALLFYRMGDFYEMFHDDAKTASRVLEIALTARNKNDPEPIPMCGVPVKAVDVYIAKLIQNDLKVAICEQVEDAALAKGLVKREVVRIITPGMIVDEHLLDEKSNNFIAALSFHKDIWGLASLDLSTATFKTTESRSLDAIRDEIARIRPSEILIPEGSGQEWETTCLAPAFHSTTVTETDDRNFLAGNGRQSLLTQFRTRSLEGFGIKRAGAGVGAAGALLEYVKDTQKQDITHIRGIQRYALDRNLLIDDTTFRNLELTENLRDGRRKGSLLDVMDHTVTAMGGRMLRQWLSYPLLDREAILARHDAVEEALQNGMLRREIREILKQVYDLERIATKVAMGHCHARDLLSLRTSLFALPGILEQLSAFAVPAFSFSHPVEPLLALATTIDSAIREDAPISISEGGVIKSGYDADLDELISIATDGKTYLARLEASEREKTGIPTLKVKFNKVFGYFLEVSKAHAASVPEHFIRKQTLVNAERYITEELKEFESKVLGAQEQRARLEYTLFDGIRKTAADEIFGILSAAGFLSEVDVLCSLAELAQENQYCRAKVTHDGIIDIVEGRHPVVEKMLVGDRYVPNSVYLDNSEQQVLVITGPNMAGKSTVLRQVALITLMAQMGSFVPAESATISITDRIFTRVGASDNLAQGQSTFMVEMEEAANILNNATPDSLVVMDEIGRGTSTFDGLSIAWAVAEYLHDHRRKGVKTLFATHYHEMTELSRIKDRVQNFSVAVREWNDNIIFLRKLVKGGANRSYGIQVAKLAGLPDSVIHRAKELLTRVENGEHLLGYEPQTDPDQDDDGRMQLHLFPKPEERILQSLREMDPNTMTPMDALHLLCALKEKLAAMDPDLH